MKSEPGDHFKHFLPHGNNVLLRIAHGVCVISNRKS